MTPPRGATHEWTLWVVAGACALHVAEEYLTGWQAWALPTLGLSPGVYTATLLYLSFSSWALVGAARDGVPKTAIVAGLVLGILMMGSVVLGSIWLSGTAAGG